MRLTKVSRDRVIRVMEKAEANSRSGRLVRLRFLTDEGDFTEGPMDGLSYEYFEEARLCWYAGAFVAAIVMSQLAFEEALRSHYRLTLGPGGLLASRKEVDRAGFADLIEQARHDQRITLEEAEALGALRKDYRNAYVHTKDLKGAATGSTSHELPPFAIQHFKIVAPEVAGTSVEDEARHAIHMLITMLPRISRRWFGL